MRTGTSPQESYIKAIIAALIDMKHYSSSENVSFKNLYERIVLEIHEYMHKFKTVETLSTAETEPLLHAITIKVFSFVLKMLFCLY